MPGQTPQPPRQPYRAAAPRRVTRTPAQQTPAAQPRAAAPQPWPTAPNRAAPQTPQPWPTAPGRTPPPPPPAPGDPAQAARRREAARRARQIRRNRRRLAFGATVVGILVVSGIITLLLPADAQQNGAAVATAAPAAPPAAQQLVAPLPYNGGDGTANAQTLDWGAVGPVRQQAPYQYTAAPAAPGPTLPESGKVDITWFSDAAFLGDSITAGLQDYNINLSGGLVCGYVGARPNQIVNRETLTNNERGEEVPLDVLAQRQPRKVYVLMGTNALHEEEEKVPAAGFLNYYGAMLDALRATLPDASIYVQPVLPVRPEALADSPGLATDRLAGINSALLAMCAEKGCYYVDLYEALVDETGALREDYAETDGIHLKKAAYSVWLDYLCTHVPYDKANPYQPGAEFYLNDALRAQLADIP